MEFVLYCIDKPGRANIRKAMRVPHLKYAGSRQHHFRFGGPLLDEEGIPKGSLMILHMRSREELKAHMCADPFFSSDLFDSVTVWSTHQVLPEREPGALAREVEESRATAEGVAANAASALRLQSGPAVVLGVNPGDSDLRADPGTRPGR